MLRCTGLRNASSTTKSRKSEQAVIEARDVQKRTGLAVTPKLSPGPHLEELFQRTDTAWQGDEPIRQFGHQRLALVHRGDDPQVRKAGMRHLQLDQGTRDHADDLAPGSPCRIGHCAHEPDRGPAIDEADATLGQKCSQLCGGGEICRIAAGAGTAEDAKTVHAVQLLSR